MSAINRLVARATPSLTASLPNLALCSSLKLYSSVFYFLMLQEGYLHRSFQIVGGVVLSFPVINHCLSDDILKDNDQKKEISLTRTLVLSSGEFI